MMATAAIQEAVVRSSSCIQDVKSLKGVHFPTTVLHVKVLDVGAPTLDTNTELHVVTARIADESSYTDVHVYDSAKFPLFRVGEAIIVSHFGKKADGSLTVTQTSNVRTTNKDMVTVPEEIVDLSKRKPKVKTGTPTTKRLQNTRKEVPSKRLKVKDDNEVIDLTSPSNVSTSRKSQTKSGTPTKQQPKKTEVPIKGVVDLTSSSNETDTSVSPSQESHTKHLSSTNSVRPQQSVTIQPPTSAITQQGISQVHLSTVVTTATSVPSLGCKSTSSPAIHPKPSGVSQQLPKSVGERNSAIIGQPTELSSNPTISSASTSQKSQSKRSSSPCPVLPQQSMTLQPHKLAIKQQGSAQVHLSTVVTTTTSVPSLVRTSAPGFGIQSTPSGAPQKSHESVCERNSTILVQPTGLSSNETAIFVATSRESQLKSTETSKGLPQTCVGDQPVPKASEDKKGPKRDGSLTSHPNYDGDQGGNQGGVRGEHCTNGGDQSDMSKEAAMQERLSVRKESPGGGSKQIQRSSFSAYPALGNKGEHPRTTPEKKSSASTFTKESLEKLNVSYNEKPTEMKDFFKMVKSKATEKISGANLKETMDTFKRITKEQLKRFSIDLDDLTETKNQNNHNTKSRKKEVMHHITFINDEIDIFFKKAVQKKEYKEPRIIRLLTHWKTAVAEFMQNCADVVHSILQPEILPRLFPSDNEVEESPGEILYHNLFMSFSRIFLLRPRQQRKVYNKIRKDIIPCQSDMCFLQSLFSPCTDAPKLVMMCEVKRKEPFKRGRQNKSIWIEKKIDSNAMGQIGMELLSESTGSFFSPGVAGIACLRSEIMFLFLDISEDHIQALKEDDASLDGKYAKIYYTETYDILKPDDRIKFMDILLYFAAIQSGNFIYPL
ncbi:uncharacterized protein LOC125657801 isoform X2 [Ostrea edulis]|uniref:uncharacterized protein LOC125657801 isoform X2 n=1 Tax=Ostrea edulis TaxID=37623 RepID=UPI0024AF8478|nr:uncharacterized protein LOC125657801 isoform X2 [Ostrea edulis]